MLRGLDIRDLLIIDRLELEFQPGLNVLTGETGAGKSILLDSLGFVLGWRGRADLVRRGAEQGEVTAVFDLPAQHPARALLEGAGFFVEEELVLRRINKADGRKTAWINDRRASGEFLRELSELLVELHGQQDDKGLLDPRVHRRLLDEFGGLIDDVVKVRGAWRVVSQAQKALDLARDELTKAQAEEEFLRHSVAELDALSPEIAEDESLDRQRRLMQASERVGTDISKALHTLSAQDGAQGRMGDALRWLEGANDQFKDQTRNQARNQTSDQISDQISDQASDQTRDQGSEDPDDILAPAITTLGRAMAELDDAVQEVEDVMQHLSFNPHELEAIEERLFALRALARKHKVAPDDLGAFANDLRERLVALDAGAGAIEALETSLASAQNSYETKAHRLSKARKNAAKSLDQAMSQELAPLKMDRAVFTTEVSQAPAGPDGLDQVVFTVATNPGAPSGALNKIASGGELSRFLLALKVCLTRDTEGLTMIFDEIDRGVGGATADAVGRRLALLAQGPQVTQDGQDEQLQSAGKTAQQDPMGQVLVVTHSPQVAALGAHHWRVQKSVKEGLTLSTVVPLDRDARIDEIARMISGDTITDAGRAAAKELLKG